MSISGPSPALNLYIRGWQSDQVVGFKQRQPQLVALSQALSTGDLSAARSAFSGLQQEIQTAPQTQNGQPTSQSTQNGQNSVVSALQALGQALTSGNIPAAQSAFTTLQQDLQNAGQAHHHHHHHGSGGGQGGSSSTASAASAATTSTINVKA